MQEKHVRLEAVDGIIGPEPLAAKLNGENRPVDYLRLIEAIFAKMRLLEEKGE